MTNSPRHHIRLEVLGPDCTLQNLDRRECSWTSTENENDRIIGVAMLLAMLLEPAGSTSRRPYALFRLAPHDIPHGAGSYARYIGPAAPGDVNPWGQPKTALAKLLRVKLDIDVKPIESVGKRYALDPAIEWTVDLVEYSDLIEAAMMEHADDPGALVAALLPLTDRCIGAATASSADRYRHLTSVRTELEELELGLLAHAAKAALETDHAAGLGLVDSLLNEYPSQLGETGSMCDAIADRYVRGAPGAQVGPRVRRLATALGPDNPGVVALTKYAARVDARDEQSNVFDHRHLRTPSVGRFAAAMADSLGVRSARDDLFAGGVVRYVPRTQRGEILSALHAALRSSSVTTLILVGPEAAGKTRLLHECVREVWGTAWLVAPRPEYLKETFRPSMHRKIVEASPLDPVVLWLDDLDRIVTPSGGGLTADDLRELRELEGGRPLLVACTYSGAAPAARGDAAHPLAMQAFLTAGRMIPVPAELDPQEMIDVAALLGPEVERQTRESDNRLGAIACAAPLLLAKYAAPDADGDRGREGRALVEGLLAWRRAVSHAPVTKTMMRVIWKAYRQIPLEPDDARYALAEEWATGNVIGEQRLVFYSRTDEAWLPDPMLDSEVAADHVAKLHRYLANVIEEWVAGEPTRMLKIAERAAQDGLVEIAEVWYARAAEHPGVVGPSEAVALRGLAAVHEASGDHEAAVAADELALTVDPTQGDVRLEREYVADPETLEPFRREADRRRTEGEAAPARVTEAVRRLFCDVQSRRFGPYQLLDQGRTVVDDALYRYEVGELRADGSLRGVTRDLIVFENIEAELGGGLWDQEVRTLLRLGDRRHPALPELAAGGYDADAKIGWIATHAARWTIDELSTFNELRADPARCVRELAELADALCLLHGHGIVHRNLWPGTVELVAGRAEQDREGFGGTLRLGRFEMSAHLDALVRKSHDPADTRTRNARLFYARQGIRALQYFAPERIDAILALGGDTLEPGELPGNGDSFTADVFGLGAIAYEWFVEPIPTRRFVIAGASGQTLRRQLRALRDHMRLRVGRDTELPAKLRTLLLGMLSESARGRLTAGDVVAGIADAYDALQQAFEPETELPPLVAFMPELSRHTIHRWGWTVHDPATDLGKDDLRDVIETDLRRSILVYSPRGAVDYIREPRGRDARSDAKLVLIGSRGAWFGHVAWYTEYGKRKDLDGVLLIDYVAWRHHAEALLDQPIRRRISHVNAVAFDPGASLTAVRHIAQDRPSWRDFERSVHTDVELQDEEADFVGALRWLLDYQEARHRLREYAFTSAPGNAGWVTLQFDRTRDDEMLKRDPLAIEMVGERHSFVEFFTSDDLRGDQPPQVRGDERGRPARRGLGSINRVVRKSEAEINVLPETGTTIPHKGWLRPGDSSSAGTELRRQAEAFAELRYRHGLLAQIVRPSSLGGPEAPWDHVGQPGPGDEGLRGSGRRIAKQILVERPFSAIHGPPGTGKSTITARVVEAYLDDEPSARVLVSAQANAALDALAEKILRRVTTNGPNGVLALRLGQQRKQRSNAIVDECRPHKVVDRLMREIPELIEQELEEGTHCEEARVIARRWKAALPHAAVELKDRVLRGANLVFATCSGANRDALDTGSAFAAFDWVFVEEAAKAWPTELAIPLVRGVRWTLIGDHLQLPAYRRDAVVATLHGFRRSLNEELAAIGERAAKLEAAFAFFGGLFAEPRDDKKPLVTLKTQFRMREPIARMVSHAFYKPHGVTLKTDPRTEVEHGLRGIPKLRDRALAWIDTSGTGAVEGGCWRNEDEARLIERIVHRLFGLPATDLSPAQLAILTPWHEQRRVLEARLSGCREVIHTVDSFQGGEADVVLVSLVRTQTGEPLPSRRLGLLSAPERCNVMLSRAKQLLVVVGSFRCFEESGVAHWTRVTEEFEAQRAVLDADSVGDA